MTSTNPSDPPQAAAMQPKLTSDHQPERARSDRAGAARTFPAMAAEVDQIEPAPRRVRGVLNGQVVFDTTRAIYVWEWPNYPQYYIPVEDVIGHVLVDEHHEQQLRRATASRHGLLVGDVQRNGAAWLFHADAPPGIAGMVRFEWAALDAWFEEDEEVFVHPRNPYTRVDALRSHRLLRIESTGAVLAETRSPVLVFETGLPTRYYIDKTDVRFEHLVRTDTQTSCPYKGTTTRYWSVQVDSTVHEDLAWTYDHPTTALAAIAGMVGFYNEKVDVILDGQPLERPVTHFFDA